MSTAIDLLERMEAEWKVSGRITWPAYEVEARTLLKYGADTLQSRADLACSIAALARQMNEIRDAMYRLGFMPAPAIEVKRSDPRMQASMGQDGGSDFKLQEFDGTESAAQGDEAARIPEYRPTGNGQYMVREGDGGWMDANDVRRYVARLREKLAEAERSAEHDRLATQVAELERERDHERDLANDARAKLATRDNRDGTLATLEIAHQKARAELAAMTERAEKAEAEVKHQDALVSEYNTKANAARAEAEALRAAIRSVAAFGKPREVSEAAGLRSLLIRYIRHVRACEGVDFIESGAHYNQDSFDDHEWGILKDLAK